MRSERTMIRGIEGEDGPSSMSSRFRFEGLAVAFVGGEDDFWAEGAPHDEEVVPKPGPVP